MAIVSLSDDAHVVRHVSKNLVDRDDDTGVIRGIFPQAFELRPTDDGYLSAAWQEFFVGPKRKQVAGVAAFIGKTRKITLNQAFVSGCVRDVKNTCADFGQKIRILHEPCDDNLAYAAIRRYQSDNLDLLELLASEAWCDVTDAKDIIGLMGPWPAEK